MIGDPMNYLKKGSYCRVVVNVKIERKVMEKAINSNFERSRGVRKTTGCELNLTRKR